MDSLHTIHFFVILKLTKTGELMEDIEPMITEEEWQEFLTEFNLELEEHLEDRKTDVDDFFDRLSSLEDSNW